MVVQNASLFAEIDRQLQLHASHTVALARYGDTLSADWIGVECHDCRELLLEFLPAHRSEHYEPEQVRYEGHYDDVREICYVEVLKPGKAPYPLQERQDVINHSPAGISWGYAGSGPAQCALAILLDYLGDEEQARSIYQDFKFKVIAGLPQTPSCKISNRIVFYAHGTQRASPPAGRSGNQRVSLRVTASIYGA